MTLLAIAEVMSGEALVTPGGPVDRDTAAADDIELWPRIPQEESAPDDATGQMALPAQRELISVR